MTLGLIGTFFEEVSPLGVQIERGDHYWGQSKPKSERRARIGALILAVVDRPTRRDGAASGNHLMLRKFIFGSSIAVALVVTSPATGQTLYGSTGKVLQQVDAISGTNVSVGTGYQYATQTEEGIRQLARAADGTLYGISASTVQSYLYTIDDSTGQSTPHFGILFGGFPFPVTPMGLAVDPTTGTAYFLNTFGFVPWPTLTPLEMATGEIGKTGRIGPTQSDLYSGLCFDKNGVAYTVNRTAGALWRIDKSDPENNSGMVGTGLGLNVDMKQGVVLARDIATDVVYGYTVADQQLFIIDLATGSGAVVVSVQGHFLLGLASEAGNPCGGSVTQYGKGCGGTSGLVPSVDAMGCPEVGQVITITIDDGLANGSALLFFGLGQSQLSMGGGCDLLVAPLTPLILNVPLGATGSANFGGPIPAGASGVSFTLQAMIADPNGTLGFSNSNGLKIDIL